MKIILTNNPDDAFRAGLRKLGPKINIPEVFLTRKAKNNSDSDINQERNNYCLRAIYFIIPWSFNDALFNSYSNYKTQYPDHVRTATNNVTKYLLNAACNFVGK